MSSWRLNSDRSLSDVSRARSSCTARPHHDSARDPHTAQLHHFRLGTGTLRLFRLLQRLRPSSSSFTTAMAIEEPALPAIIPPSDGPHTAELETAYALFREELASTEGWIDQGETNGVQIYSKPDPEVSAPILIASCTRELTPHALQDAYGVPTVKGEALITGDVTSDQVSVDPTVHKSHQLITLACSSSPLFSSPACARDGIPASNKA